MHYEANVAFVQTVELGKITMKSIDPSKMWIALDNAPLVGISSEQTKLRSKLAALCVKMGINYIMQRYETLLSVYQTSSIVRMEFRGAIT